MFTRDGRTDGHFTFHQPQASSQARTTSVLQRGATLKSCRGTCHWWSASGVADYSDKADSEHTSVVKLARTHYDADRPTHPPTHPHSHTHTRARAHVDDFSLSRLDRWLSASLSLGSSALSRDCASTTVHNRAWQWAVCQRVGLSVLPRVWSAQGLDALVPWPYTYETSLPTLHPSHSRLSSAHRCPTSSSISLALSPSAYFPDSTPSPSPALPCHNRTHQTNSHSHSLHASLSQSHPGYFSDQTHHHYLFL
jgi:hypothetical protein